MNIRTIAYLFLICVFCFSCTPKEKTPTDFTIEFSGAYPPEVTAIVTLKLEGETLPGIPKVVSANDTSAALFEQIGFPEEVQQLGNKDVWVTALEKDKSYVIGWIVEDNKMFGYCSEPFLAQNGTTVTFSPGLPATIEYDITEQEEGLAIFPGVLLLSRKATKNGAVAMMDFGVAETLREPEVVKIKGLAQGTYRLWAQALNAEGFVTTRTRFLYDKRIIEVKSGESIELKAEYPLVDTTVDEGDLTIKGMAYNSAGEPLENEEIKLIPINDEGPRFDLYYPNVITDSKGSFGFTGVHPDMDILIKSAGGSINLPGKYLVKDSTLWIDFLIGELNQRIFTDYAIPDISVIWENGELSSIQSLWGKIAVVIAWSSWCPPSQEAITKLNSIAEKYKDNEDIVFVALSTDYSNETWKDIISKPGLDSLRHCWYDLELNKLALNLPIPHTIIFDKENIVRADGLNVDIEAELKKVIEASKNSEESEEE